MVVTPDQQPLRVVVDPNVLISAAISNGVSRTMLDLGSLGAFRLIACPHLLGELKGVLQRETFLRWRTREQLDQFVHEIERLVQLEPDPIDVPLTTKDPDDDYLVALALASKADLLCSGDHDFDEVTTVMVVSPGDLARRLLGS